METVFRKHLACVVMAALLMLAGPSASPSDQADSQGGRRADVSTELSEIRARMKQEQDALQKILQEQGNLLGKLEGLKAQMKRSRERLFRLSRERGILEAESQDLKQMIEEFEVKAQKQRAGMNQRLRARYRFGRRGEFSVLFNAENVADFSRRHKYLEALFRADRKKIAEYAELIGDWSAARQKLESRQASLDDLATLLTRQGEQLQEQERTMNSVLRSIREERSTHEAMLAELKQSEARLKGVLGDLDRRSRDSEIPSVNPGTPFAGLRGSLCYPAAGPVISGFGRRVHPRFNTVTMQNGVEIGAASGAAVKAAGEGVVRFAEWFRGYGNLVIVDHGDGYYTIYAHLARIKVRVGQAVTRGQVVGTVGDTGSLEGPSLYFEIRHHQTALDPADWTAGCSL